MLPPQQEVRFFNDLSVDVATDIDWFRFILSAGAKNDEFVSLDFTSPQGALDLGVSRPDGSLVGQSATSRDTETVSLNGLAAGDYFARITGFAGDTNAKYRLAISFPGSDWADATAPNDTLATVYNFAVQPTGVNYADNLSVHTSTDVDWFKFTTANAFTAASYVKIDFTHAQGDRDVALYNSGGSLLGVSNGVLDGERISLAGRPAGTYYVQVYGYAGDTNPSYALTITAPAGTASRDRFEANDRSDLATDLGILEGARSWGADDRGTLSIHDGRDIDWYRFEVTEVPDPGFAAGIAFEHAKGDLALALYNPAGTTLLRSSNGLTDRESIDLGGLATGTYLLRVTGVNGAANRGHDSIAAYRVADDGRLTLIAIEPSLGKGPQNLAITPDGRWLLCANMPGNSIAVFRIDAGTGRLKSAGERVSQPSPSCIMLLP